MRKCFAFVFAVALMFSTVISVYAEDKTLAFPGAEGGGKFSPGQLHVFMQLSSDGRDV